MLSARKLIIAAVTILSAGALALGPGIQGAWAQMPPTDICDSASYCLNAWDGGPWIKTYTVGVANDYFYVVQLTEMCNKGVSTSSCPLSGSLNIPGLLIYQIQYGNEYAGHTNNCLADDGARDGQTAFGYCNALNGTGGSDGTIYLAYHGTCPSGSNIAISREWTDSFGNYRGIYFLDGNGNTVYDNFSASSGSGIPCLFEVKRAIATSPLEHAPAYSSYSTLPARSIPGTHKYQP